MSVLMEIMCLYDDFARFVGVCSILDGFLWRLDGFQCTEMQRKGKQVKAIYYQSSSTQAR